MPESEFGGLKVIFSVETGFGGDFAAQNTKFAILNFVSRHNAVFSAPTIFRGNLEV